MLELPWNKSSEEGLDLMHVRTVLNEDHHGIKGVKNGLWSIWRC